MRNISCSETIPQVRDGSKTVTRRLGWGELKAGDRLRVVEKAMGLKKGEHIKPLAIVRVLKVSAEWIKDIPLDDVAKEGFLGWSSGDFIDYFCRYFPKAKNAPVTRIEWEYIFRFSGQEENGHIIGTFGNDRYRSCFACLNIRPKNGYVSTCRGKARLRQLEGVYTDLKAFRRGQDSLKK